MSLQLSLLAHRYSIFAINTSIEAQRSVLALDIHFFIRNHFQKYLSASKTKSPITLDTLLGAPKSAISLNAQYSALQKESLENFVGCWARHDFFDQNDIIAHEALRLIKLYKIIHKDFLITISSSIYQSDVYGFLLYSSIKDFLRRNQIKDFSLHSTSRSSFRIF